MKSFLKKIKANALASAILYTILGAVLLLWPATSAQVLTLALGLVLVLCGLGNLLDFLLHRDGSLYSRLHLIAGIILIVIGLWLMTQPDLLTVVVPRIMGLLICIHGSCKILLDNGKEKKVVPLEKPYEGLYVSNAMWREMFDFSPKVYACTSRGKNRR